MATVINPPRPLDRMRRSVSAIWARANVVRRAHPRGTVGVAVAGVAGVIAVAAVNLAPGAGPAQQQAAPPAPPPMVVKAVSADEAVKLNAAIPVAGGPNPAAAPFAFKGSASARAQALNCLASAVYYEAGNQDVDGERAVAQVVLNRVRHPAFPSTVCGVVFEGSTKPTGCQFTFTCDNSLDRTPSGDGWRRATEVAEAALNGFVYAPVGWATHYHADYVVPVWAASMAKNAVVGAHLFYRWAGSWGRPGAFAQAYTGREPNASALRQAALAVPHITPSYAQGQLAKAIDEIPGAEPIKLNPSLRGDKRVAVRFNLAARQASDDVKHEEYSKKFEVSDNLKWSLSNETVAENQAPLGKSAAAGSASSAAATGQR